MARCQVDKSIERKIIDGFECPLGVYPVDDSQPRAGYTVDFEPGDGDDEDGEWEEWPDRYVFDVVVTASRLESLCRTLYSILPGRVFPILDVLGNDAYREVDPYLAYDLVGLERFLDSARRYKEFLLEDGLIGFGAMAREPFVSVFVDEHKIVTVRVETALKERVEKVLSAFDLEQVESLTGVDNGTHEHRGVLNAPDDREDLLTGDEIVEQLRDDWDLVLNVDAESNLDDEGKELGMTGWRCLVRWTPPPGSSAGESASVRPGQAAALPASGPDQAAGAGDGEVGEVQRADAIELESSGSPVAESSESVPGAAGGESGLASSRSGMEPGEEPKSKESGAGTGPGGADAAAGRASGAAGVGSRYVETLITATCLREAEDLALDAALGLIGDEDVDEESIFVVASDRLTPEEVASAVKAAINGEVDMETAKSYAVRWLE